MVLNLAPEQDGRSMTINGFLTTGFSPLFPSARCLPERLSLGRDRTS
jgi:hypothetical protein